MKYQRKGVYKNIFFCLILLFFGLMSTTVTHAETYKFVAKWGSNGSGDGEFKSPCDVAVDSSGNVYVVDSEINRIQKFDNSGTFITKWGSYGSGDGQFNQPLGVAVDSSGNVYVADTVNNRIQKFDNSGTFITKWGSSGTGDARLTYPVGVAVDSTGNVYVVDDSADHVASYHFYFNYFHIHKFDSSGTFITKWGDGGTPQFNHPIGIAVDSSGNLYVADDAHQCIQKFNSRSNDVFGQRGPRNVNFGQFFVPPGIAVDSSGNVYVAVSDPLNSLIHKFNINGTSITTWGSRGSGDGQFNAPHGVAVDSSGNVYVSEYYNHRIQKFAKEGNINPTITWNTPADIGYGTPLSSTQLNAVSSVPGTFTYTPPSGTVLSAGMQTLHVDFTPTDTANYNTASKDIKINVNKADPIVTWNTPADIGYGTPLSSTQLNAVATDPVTMSTVDGTFTYTPAEGTILGAGMGQALHVDFVPADTANYNTASADVTINVIIPPPTINSIAVPLDPVQAGTSITTSADVTYLGDLSTLTAEWNWGDDSTSEPQVSSDFAASHVYNSAGVYTITFTLKDQSGGIYTQTSPNCVVVYDPQGGFVTGSGWINSPAGAYVPDNTLEGKATFGFVSKYQKGAIVPTGNTEFQLKVADLNFHSENYDWLVVAGSQAKYKGTGTINGEGNYGLMLSAVDGAIKEDGIDKFRIKIWDKESGNTIYDNEVEASEDSEPSTAISGGSIVIHKEK